MIRCTCAKPVRTKDLDIEFEHGSGCPFGKLIEDLGYRLVEYNTIDAVRTKLGPAAMTNEMMEQARKSIGELWRHGDRPVDYEQRKHYRGMAWLAIRDVLHAERAT